MSNNRSQGMTFNRVKTKRIYSVNFNPVNRCEFDSEHLALVLKKNNDKKTCIVMPLTSSPNGIGVNKVNIGKISTLPSNLRTVDSYAVYDQIRTVNVDRFKPLKEGQAYVDALINDELFLKLLDLGTKEMLYTLNLDERIKFHKNQCDNAYVSKMISLAYTALRLKREIDNLQLEQESYNSTEINGLNDELVSIKNQIIGIINMDIEYILTQPQIDDGIKELLDSLVN